MIPVNRTSQILTAIAAVGAATGLWIVLKTPLVVVALGVLPFIALTVFRYPVVVVIGFVVFSLFRIHEAYPALYSLRLPQLLALAAIATIAYQLFSRRMRPYLSLELKICLVFFVLISVSVPLASNFGLAFAFWSGTYVKIAVMVFAIAWLVSTPGHLALASRIFVLAGLLVAIVAIQNKLHGIGLVEGTRVTIGRDFGSMLGDPNDLALVLLFPTGFAMAMVLRKGLSVTDRVFAFLALAAIVTGILYTQSRGGLLGLMAVVGVFAWNRTERKALLVFAGLAAGALLFVMAGVTERSVVAAADGIDESSMGRLYAWEAAFRMAVANPFTGVGLDNFYANYFFHSPHWDGLNHAVHSTWFGVLAEAGFLGFSIFVSLVFITARRSIRSEAASRAFEETHNRDAAWIATSREALLASLAGFVVSGTFLTQGFIWPFYILLALIVAADRISPRQATTVASRYGDALPFCDAVPEQNSKLS